MKRAAANQAEMHSYPLLPCIQHRKSGVTIQIAGCQKRAQKGSDGVLPERVSRISSPILRAFGDNEMIELVVGIIAAKHETQWPMFSDELALASFRICRELPVAGSERLPERCSAFREFDPQPCFRLFSREAKLQLALIKVREIDRAQSAQPKQLRRGNRKARFGDQAEAVRNLSADAFGRAKEMLKQGSGLKWKKTDDFVVHYEFRYSHEAKDASRRRHEGPGEERGLKKGGLAHESAPARYVGLRELPGHQNFC